MKLIDYLNMDEWTFDQSEIGWRSYKGSNKQKIDLILTYVDHKKPRELKQIMLWHVGQLAAERNDVKTAIKYMTQCISDDNNWNTYVRCTIAFILNDKNEFLTIIKENPIETNSNKQLIEKLNDIFGEPYKEFIKEIKELK